MVDISANTTKEFSVTTLRQSDQNPTTKLYLCTVNRDIDIYSTLYSIDEYLMYFL